MWKPAPNPGVFIALPTTWNALFPPSHPPGSPTAILYLLKLFLFPAFLPLLSVSVLRTAGDLCTWILKSSGWVLILGVHLVYQVRQQTPWRQGHIGPSTCLWAEQMLNTGWRNVWQPHRIQQVKWTQHTDRHEHLGQHLKTSGVKVKVHITSRVFLN